jgi:hypothetical protein
MNYNVSNCIYPEASFTKDIPTPAVAVIRVRTIMLHAPPKIIPLEPEIELHSIFAVETVKSTQDAPLLEVANLPFPNIFIDLRLTPSSRN